MDREQLFGIALIAVGILLMILPAFTAALILVIVDLLLVVLGANLIYREFKKGEDDLLRNRRTITGIILIALALIFFFGFNHTSFVAGIEFILMGIVFMLLGLLGLKGYIYFSKIVCTIVLIMGIVIFIVPFLTGFDLKTSTFIVGLTTLVEGILFFLHK